jgi:parallel beta-helix repeat protein
MAFLRRYPRRGMAAGHAAVTKVAPAAANSPLPRGRGARIVVGVSFSVGFFVAAICLAFGSHLMGHPASAEVSGRVFYVSPNGNDAWSGQLANPSSNGSDGPFATIQRAINAMRADGSGDAVIIEGGTYHLTQPISLRAHDSGDTFKAYPGETPVISGGQEVTGWVNEGNGIYSAALSQPTDLELYVGGVPQHVAQSGNRNPADPYSGWLFANQAPSGPSTNSFTFRPGDLRPSDFIPGELIEVYSTLHQWEGRIVPVQSIDFTTGVVTLGAQVPMPIDSGSTYRLLNNPDFIKQPGEFAWRASDGHLVYMPTDPAEFQHRGVVVPRLDHLIDINGATGITIAGLTFTDTTRTTPDLAQLGAVSIENSNNITVQQNTFQNVGTGVSLQASSNDQILNNTLTDIAGNGIRLINGGNQNQISGNEISAIGQWDTFSAGIWLSGAGNNVISHNLVKNTPRAGIWLSNANVSDENVGNTIEYNAVLHTNQQTQDSGAIYMLGRTGINTNTTIQYNYIQDTGNPALTPWGAWYQNTTHGIYLDDLSSGVNIYGNFIKDSYGASVFLHGSSNVVVQNSVGYIDNSEPFLKIQDISGSEVNRAVENNIIYSTNPLGTYSDLRQWNGQSATVDHNLLYNVSRFSGQDQHSIIADPLFVDAANGNYQLQSGSPAYQVGFKDLPRSSM